MSHTGWVLKKDYEPPEDLFVYIGAKVKCKVGTAVEYSDEELKKGLDRMEAFIRRLLPE